MDRTLSLQLNPFSGLGIWVCKSFRRLRSGCGAHLTNGLCLKRVDFEGMVVNNSVFCDSPCFLEEKGFEMEGETEKGIGRTKEDKLGSLEDGKEIDIFVDSSDDGRRESSWGSDFLASEATGKDDQSHSSSEESFSSHSVAWMPPEKEEPRHSSSSNIPGDVEKPHLHDEKLEKQGSSISGILVDFTLIFNPPFHTHTHMYIRMLLLIMKFYCWVMNRD